MRQPAQSSVLADRWRDWARLDDDIVSRAQRPVPCFPFTEDHRQDSRSGPMTQPSEPILQLRGVNKSFGAVQVLHDVDLKIYPGQVTALVGDNGAGKSTLVKCVAGIHGIDTGDYLFEGKPVTVHSPRDAAALGIEIVYQDLALCDNLDIVQNMFLGREPKSGLVLDEAQMEIKARDTLASLSVGQRQTVAIAKSVLWNSKVVMLDEPTAALGVAQTRQVLDLVRRLADNGL